MAIDSNNYKGQWVTREPVRNEGGQLTHKTINVLKCEDGLVRAIGENIPIEKFDKIYCRPSEIADPEHNPFKSDSAMKGVNKNNIKKPEPNEDKATVKDDNYNYEPQGVEDGIDSKITEKTSSKQPNGNSEKPNKNFTKNEEFILNAIEIAKSKDESTNLNLKNLDVDVPLSFNLSDIIQVSETMGLDNGELLSVMKEEFGKKENIDPIIDEILKAIIQKNKK